MRDMRADREAQRLRELLDQATPQAPVDSGRLAGVRATRRRARTLRAGTAGVCVGLVALGVVVVPHFFSTSPVTNGTNTGAARDPGALTPPRAEGTSAAAGSSRGSVARSAYRPTPGPTQPLSCASASGSLQPAQTPPDGLLPPGAVRARICPQPEQWVSWLPPKDDVTTGLAALTDLVDSQPLAPRSQICGAVASESDYFITFQYPDGGLVRLWGTLSGCGSLSVGTPNSTAHVGAPQILRAYLERLETQRSSELSSPPFGSGTRVVCPAVGRSVSVTPIPSDSHLALTSGAVCQYTAQGTLVRDGTLSTSDLALLVRNFQTRADPARSDCVLDRRLGTRIIAVDRWGDQVSWLATTGNTGPGCSPFMRWDDFLGPGGAWRPSRQVLQLLVARLGS